MSDGKDDLTPGEFPPNLGWSEHEVKITLENLYQFVNKEK